MRQCNEESHLSTTTFHYDMNFLFRLLLAFWQIQKLFETTEEDQMEYLDEILGEARFS